MSVFSYEPYYVPMGTKRIISIFSSLVFVIYQFPCFPNVFLVFVCLEKGTSRKSSGWKTGEVPLNQLMFPFFCRGFGSYVNVWTWHKSAMVYGWKVFFVCTYLVPCINSQRDVGNSFLSVCVCVCVFPTFFKWLCATRCIRYKKNSQYTPFDTAGIRKILLGVAEPIYCL